MRFLCWIVASPFIPLLLPHSLVGVGPGGRESLEIESEGWDLDLMWRILKRKKNTVRVISIHIYHL